MPTPRQHGGAALQNIPLAVPGFMGLNTEMASGLIGPEWATALTNAVIDANGRVAARKGWDNAISSEIAVPFSNIAEYVQADGSVSLMAHSDDRLLLSVDGGSTWSNITGTAVVDNLSQVRFYNFNDLCVAIQDGNAPSISSGGNFVVVADVNAPQGGVGCAAFGRMWIVGDDGHTLYYSNLLDATDWTNTGSGSIDLFNVWPTTDTITAVEAYNGALVVFGKKTTVVWTDGAGSALGVDPTTMYVADVIKNTGCVATNSVQHVDGDLWFLSDVGLQSLGRLIQEKSNPLQNLSLNVQGMITSYVSAADLSLLRSVYSPNERVYLLSLPSGGTTESGRCLVFDTRQKLPDGSARCMGTWTLVPTACVLRRDGTLAFQIKDSTGGANYGVYSGQLDDAASYVFDYESGWLDVTGQGLLLLPKKYTGVFYADNDVEVVFKYALDFADAFTSRSKLFTSGSVGGGEWGSGEWGTTEFGGGVSLLTGGTNASKSGKYIKIGITCNINNIVFAVQQLNLYCKIGRMA